MGQEHRPILMQQQDIEPPISVPWHKHPHAVAPQFKVHPLIFDVPDAVHAKIGAALPEKDGTHSHAGVLGVGIVDWEVDFAHVVD